MWEGDFTFKLSWRAGWWRSIKYGGTPEADATFRGQLVNMRMKGWQTICECCNQCMLYSVYAVLGVNSWSYHGEIERDDLTLCSAMMVEMWMRKRDMGDEDENDVEDSSGYEQSGVQLAWSGREDLVPVLLHAGSGLVPAVSGMVNWLAQEILLRPSFSWRFVSSPLPSPKNTKLSHPSLSLHAMIKSQPGSRSIGWGWEDMILPGHEDPRNWVDPRNPRKSASTLPEPLRPNGNVFRWWPHFHWVSSHGVDFHYHHHCPFREEALRLSYKVSIHLPDLHSVD